MKRITFGLSICLIVSTSGCGWLGIRDRSSDYLRAQETQPTVVPAEMNSANLGQIYPIPQIATEAVTEDSAEIPRPQPVSVNTFEQLVKIQSIDDQRWILVNSAPSELWPRIRNALNRNGIPTARAVGSEGIIETIWLSYTSDEDNEHRFRLSITPGVQPDSTEIFALHQQQVRGADADASWPQKSLSETLERDMLSLVANELAAESDYASVSLLAQKIGGDSKVEVVSLEVADPYIMIKLAFGRSWASIDYSASRGGFTTVDKNRDEGVFLVNYSGQLADDEGFFDGWFGERPEDEILKVNYHILVQAVGANVEVRVVSPEGESLDRAESLKLLNILRGNMS